METNEREGSSLRRGGLSDRPEQQTEEDEAEERAPALSMPQVRREGEYGGQGDGEEVRVQGMRGNRDFILIRETDRRRFCAQERFAG